MEKEIEKKEYNLADEMFRLAAARVPRRCSCVRNCPHQLHPSRRGSIPDEKLDVADWEFIDPTSGSMNIEIRFGTRLGPVTEEKNPSSQGSGWRWAGLEIPPSRYAADGVSWPQWVVDTMPFDLPRGGGFEKSWGRLLTAPKIGPAWSAGWRTEVHWESDKDFRDAGFVPGPNGGWIRP